MLALSACAPRVQEIGPVIQQPMLSDDAIAMPDGERLYTISSSAADIPPTFAVGIGVTPVFVH